MPTELVVQSDEQAAKMQESTQLANTWTVQDLVDSAQKVKEAMAQAMSADVHYGVIPGTRGKPSLWKPGAEKLCSLFRLGTQIELNRTELDNGHLEVEARVRLVHIPTGRHVGEGVGSCTTMESRYRFRGWEGNGTERKRVENSNPWDMRNTVVKMACKRGLVAATLIVTAASDVFSQDVEDVAGLQTPPPRRRAPPKPADVATPPPSRENLGEVLTEEARGFDQGTDAKPVSDFGAMAAALKDDQSGLKPQEFDRGDKALAWVDSCRERGRVPREEVEDLYWIVIVLICGLAEGDHDGAIACAEWLHGLLSRGAITADVLDTAKQLVYETSGLQPDREIKSFLADVGTSESSG